MRFPVSVFYFKMKSFLLLAIVFFTMQGFAQIQHSARFEKEFKSSDGYFSILSLKEEGLFVIRDKEKYEGGKKLWEVTFLDTALNEVKKVDVKSDQRNRLIGYDYVRGHVILLYRVGDSNKSDIELIQISLHNDDQLVFKIEPELSFNVTHFIQVGSSIVLGGYVNKDPTVLIYSMEEKRIKVLPGFFQKDTELVDLRTNLNKTFNVVLIERAIRDKQKLAFRTYDETGSLLLEDEIPMDPKISLQTGITSTLEREDMMIVGSWAEGNSKQSNGFFAIPIDPFNDQKIQYLAFGEMEHYLDYLKPNRAKRIQDKSKQEIKAGEIPNYINYVMPYRLAEYPKGFIMMAEVYIPSSSYNSYSNSYGSNYYNRYYSPYGYYPGYGRYYSPPYSYNNQRSVEEIKTSESIVAAFNSSGKLLWDQSLTIDDVKQSNLEQVSDFHYFDSKVVILYKLESELKSKRIVLDSNEAEAFSDKIQTNDPGEEIRSERENEGGVRYWFDDSFYVWGYHTIRNINSKEKTRDVFYINKIKVN